MRIVYHLGAHCTDEERLVRCLLKNRGLLAGQGIVRASEGVINGDIPKAGGGGGAIALDAQGVAAFPFNTGGMYRGWIGADGVPHVAIYRDDALPLPAY